MKVAQTPSTWEAESDNLCKFRASPVVYKASSRQPEPLLRETLPAKTKQHKQQQKEYCNSQQRCLTQCDPTERGSPFPAVDLQCSRNHKYAMVHLHR